MTQDSVFQQAIERLGRFAASTVYEANDKQGDMSPAIRPLTHSVRILGPAFTVRLMPGSNEGVLRALGHAPAGSVLVIDAGGTDRSTAWGGTSSMLARQRGLVGCVTNGAARDLAELRAIDLPVFASGVSVRGALKQHPGWLQQPVAVGDAVVQPGDLIVADDDGVVVVARDRVEAVAERCLQQAELEAERERRLASGESIFSVFNLREPGV